MAQAVLYLHFGTQCPGDYMRQGAQELAEQLGCALTVVDLEAAPELGHRYRVFFPGTIVVDDFAIVYPGSGAQLYASYLARGPIPGRYTYTPRPPGRCDRIAALTPDHAGAAAGICLPGINSGTAENKRAFWARMAARLEHGVLGYIGYGRRRPVAAVEVLPETLVPYAIPDPQPDSAWITCLYGVTGDRDYRHPLLAHLLDHAPKLGYRRVRAAVGEDTPYPNGPLGLFKAHGFETVAGLGPVLLRHCWDWLHLVSRSV